MKIMLKKISAVIMALILTAGAVMLTSCGKSSDTDELASGADSFNYDDIADSNKKSKLAEPETAVAIKENPIATITMQDGSEIVIELFYSKAPNTVANFISLANSGFYDGLSFHRIINGFMIQGGDPDGIGTGGPGYSIKGEFTKNGVANNISHTRGTISMARSSDMNSAGSQFFICQADSTYLDGQYAAFGKVLSGMDTVDSIASVKTDAQDHPTTAVIMKSVKVDTHGVEFPEPETGKSK